MCRLPPAFTAALSPVVFFVAIFLLVFFPSSRQQAGAAPLPSGEGAVFAREGIALLDAGAKARTFRVNGRAVAGWPLQDRGWWLESAWLPGEELKISWSEDGNERGGRYTAPLRPTPWVWRRLPWRGGAGGGTAEVGGVTALVFSRDGTLLAVGGGDGRVAVYQVESGRLVWEIFRAGRVIKHLAFSARGRRLFVGEQGVEGRLAAYGLENRSTTPLWVLDTAGELGAPSNEAPDDPYAWVRRPGAFRLLAAGGDVIAAFTHSFSGGAGRGALARLYRLRGTDGKRLWAFPPEGPLPMMITWFAADAGAHRLGLPLQFPTGGGALDGSGRVVVLDGDSGGILFEHTIAPAPPYAITSFWRGAALNPAGDRLAVSTQDGRGFLFARTAPDSGWRMVKTFDLVTPVKLGGTTVTATNGTLAATAREALFITGPSFVPLPFHGVQQSGARPPASHPRGNTVFAYGWDGTLRWIRRLENDLQGLALGGHAATPALGGNAATPALGGHVATPGGKGGIAGKAPANGAQLLVLAQGSEQPQDASAFNGITVLRLNAGKRRRGKLLFRFALEGRAVYGGVAVSNDGRWIALAEAPRILRGDPRPRGGHAVLLLR